MNIDQFHTAKSLSEEESLASLIYMLSTLRNRKDIQIHRLAYRLRVEKLTGRRSAI